MTKEKIEEKIERELLKMTGLSRMLKGTVNKVVVKSNSPSKKTKVVYQLTYKGERNVTRTIYVKMLRFR